MKKFASIVLIASIVAVGTIALTTRDSVAVPPPVGRTTTGQLSPGILSADALGRALVAASFFDVATLTAKIANDAITAAVFEAKFAAGAISATVDGRAAMAAGYYDNATLADKVADDAFTSAEFAPGAGGLFAASCITNANIGFIADDAFTSAELVAGAGGKFAPSSFDATAVTNVFAAASWTGANVSAKFSAGAVNPDRLGTAIWNATGGNFAAGDLVYISGWNAANAMPQASLAQNDAAGQQAQYIVNAAIANGASGTAVKSARIAALNTDASAAVGAPIYLSEVGTTTNTWTVTAPTAAARKSQIVGHVVVDAVAGEIYFDLEGERTGIVGSNELQALAVNNAAIGLQVVAPGNLDGTAYVAGTVITTPTYTITRQYDATGADFDVNQDVQIFNANSPAIYIIKAELMISTLEGAETLALFNTANGGGVRLSGDMSENGVGSAGEGSNAPVEANRALAANSSLFLHGAAATTLTIGTLILTVRTNL